MDLLSDDGRDADLNEILAMSVDALETLPALLLVDEKLRSAHLAHDDARHRCARNQRGAEVQAVVLADGENLPERHLRALLQGLFREALDTHDIALCDAHLLASGPDDCVHAYLDFPNKTADKYTRPEIGRASCRE